jgi:uncharacterized protein YndB with AHSA1/START domain
MTVVQSLEIKVMLQISKPIADVYEAIVDPVKMSNYFISQSNGRMEEGKSLIWRFPEFDIEIPVHVVKVVQNTYISYFWTNDNEDTLVEMNLVPVQDSSTLLTITEKSKNNDEAGLIWLKQNTEGWANFLACLKAWLEYGINLRKGGFDFMRNQQ